MLERIGNCRILEEVGAGGMAVVYKAVQEPLGRTVAIKALKTSIASEAQFAERFEREARFMASLQQENIINVHDFIKFGGTMFIVMEYVRGVDLYDLLDKADGLPTEISTIIALQVARALNHAHFRGIIHRDIKPANIMLSHQGEVKLMDFGIAHADSLSDLTETGTGLGTPSYMSPEQILGEKLDGRSDVWSLGVVFYQMLTGRKPFLEDATKSVLQKIRTERYVPARKINPKVPRPIERILSRCMAKLPADRYPSMQALIHDLEDVLASQVVVNYNAYMVSFLRDQGFLSEMEASEILATGAVRGGQQQQRLVREDKTVLRSMGLLHAVVLAILVLGGIVIQLMSKDSFARPAPAATTASIDSNQLGFLSVTVNPWAEVLIDGVHRDTTPFAKPIALTPGVHFVELAHPYFQPVKKEILIEPGKKATILETLILKQTQGKGARQ
ncbi:MAG: serine/threonine protein kinase [Myxococcota bacterium]|jgi:serine/threonine-protein kinase|nr:serine/threonine protein kinase [Myxococcota bacterium]